MKNLPFKNCDKAFDKQNAETFIMIKACEECAELTQALSKYIRGKWHQDKISEEIADVEICLEQLKALFGNEVDVNEAKQDKIRRTALKVRRYGKKPL